jgi:hypothetical protein
MIVAMSHQQALPTSRRLIPFACAGDAAGMHTEHHIQAAGGVDREELDDQVAEMGRGVANEEPHSAPLYGRRLGYPPLCAHGMNSFTDRDYGLALARLRRG